LRTSWQEHQEVEQEQVWTWRDQGSLVVGACCLWGGWRLVVSICIAVESTGI